MSSDYLALCIEYVGEPQQYRQCVALSARETLGLGLDVAGDVGWKQEAAYPIWIERDERISIERKPGMPPIELRRAGRTLIVSEGEPVVLLDQDTLEVNSRTLRIHVHGPASEAHPPQWLGDELPDGPPPNSVDVRPVPPYVEPFKPPSGLGEPPKPPPGLGESPRVPPGLETGSEPKPTEPIREMPTSVEVRSTPPAMDCDVPPGPPQLDDGGRPNGSRVLWLSVVVVLVVAAVVWALFFR